MLRKRMINEFIVLYLWLSKQKWSHKCFVSLFYDKSFYCNSTIKSWFLCRIFHCKLGPATELHWHCVILYPLLRANTNSSSYASIASCYALCIAFWIPITLFRLQTLHACSRISKMNPCSSMSRWLSLVRTITFKLITSKVAEHLLHCVAFHFHFVNWSVIANFALLAAAAAGAGLILQSAAISKSDYFTIIAQYRNIGKKFCYFC